MWCVLVVQVVVVVVVLRLRSRRTPAGRSVRRRVVPACVRRSGRVGLRLETVNPFRRPRRPLQAFGTCWVDRIP